MKQSILRKNSPPRMARRWVYGVFLGLTLGSAPANAVGTLDSQAQRFPGTLILHEGTMAANLVAVPMPEVLEEVGRLSGAHVRWLGHREQTPVSVAFPLLPLPDALRRILVGHNFLFLYTHTPSGAKLSQVLIASREHGEERVAVESQPVSPDSAAPATPGTAPGRTEATLDTLIETTLHDSTPETRLNAVIQLGGYAQEDARVKAILTQVVQSDSDPRVKEAAAEILETLK